MNSSALRLSPDAPCTLSVVVPLYNEEAVLPLLHRRLLAALAAVTGGIEIIYVDDGSTDRTGQMLQQLRLSCTSVSVVRFSRRAAHGAGAT